MTNGGMSQPAHARYPTEYEVDVLLKDGSTVRSEEHTSELQSHSFISYAVFCLKKKTN